MVPFANEKIVGPKFRGTPEDLLPRLLRQIDKLGDGYDVDGGRILPSQGQRKLEGLGRDLWRELFGNEMRLAYRQFRGSVRSILIYSDEPWIPWEMIKPYDDQGELIDDDFFAAKFELTRWLSGERSLAGKIQMEAFSCLTSNVELPKSEAEEDLIRRLFGLQAQLRDASPQEQSMEAIMRVLQEGGVGLFHLAGHGTFNPSFPNEAGFPLADGSVFRASDLQGPVQTQISQDRPLVFLNACRSGRQAWSLTNLGGWANRWVKVCGCGAFLGPQWDVRDSVAFAFAQEFYQALVLGATLGSAAKAARAAARKIAPSDPSWLAYAVYGHPESRIFLRQAKSARAPRPSVRLRKPEGVKIFEKPSGSNATDGQVKRGRPDSEPGGNVIRFSTDILNPRERIWQECQGLPEADSVLQENVSGCYSVAGDGSRDATLEQLFDDRYRLSREHMVGVGIFRSSRYLGVCREVTKGTWGIMHGALLETGVARTKNDEIWSWNAPIASGLTEGDLARQCYYLIGNNVANPALVTYVGGDVLALETSYWYGIGLLHEGYYLGIYKYTPGVLETSWGNARWLGVWGCHAGSVSADGIFKIHGKNLIGMAGEFDVTWNPVSASGM